MGQRSCHPPGRGGPGSPEGRGHLPRETQQLDLAPNSGLNWPVPSPLLAVPPVSLLKEETVAGTITSVMLEGWKL